MSTETSHDGQGPGSNGRTQAVSSASGERGSANWEQFFTEHGWIEGDKIHCPDELIFEFRFSDGHTLVVYPASNLGEGHEAAPSIVHGVLMFKNGTDIFYYPWGMVASLVTKLNPRRARKVQGREYVVDSGAEYERRFKNAADLIIEPPKSEESKTVAGTVHGEGGEGTPGRRQFSTIDPNAPSWSAGGSESDD